MSTAAHQHPVDPEPRGDVIVFPLHRCRSADPAPRLAPRRPTVPQAPEEPVTSGWSDADVMARMVAAIGGLLVVLVFLVGAIQFCRGLSILAGLIGVPAHLGSLYGALLIISAIAAFAAHITRRNGGGRPV